MLLKDSARSAALAYAQPEAASAKAQLAAFGGQRAVPEDLVVSWPAAHSGHLAALNRVIRSGKYHRVNHPVVMALEQDFAAWTGHWTVRAVSTGTAAIHVALDYAREQGPRQQGAKVVAAALNWPGAIGPIAFAGLEPVFVDVALEDAAVDPAAAIRALSGDTAAVLITHLFGNPVLVPELRKQSGPPAGSGWSTTAPSRSRSPPAATARRRSTAMPWPCRATAPSISAPASSGCSAPPIRG